MPDPMLLPSATVSRCASTEGEIAVLDPKLDTTAAAILASCTGEGTLQAGEEELAAARGDAVSELYGLSLGDELIGVYALTTRAQAVELSLLAVAERRRRQGHGTRCLHDALRRAGKRPLVVETDDDAVDFYKAVGFKLVGKRRHSSGVMRTRLGWHAPRVQPNPGGTPAPLILNRERQ